MKAFNQKGQVVILLLLVMVIGLTIGLSVVSGSILDVKLSTQSEESARAFTAAEAGVEVALESGMEGVDEISGEVGDSDYTCRKSDQASDQSSYAFPYKVEKDRSAQFYFASSANVEAQSFMGTSIRVVWSGSVPALEVSLFYKNKIDNSYNVAKFALDPDPTRANINHFCTLDAGACAAQPEVTKFEKDVSDKISTPDLEVEFKYGADINISAFNSGNNFLQIGRFRSLYNDATAVGIISSGGTFPSQGTVIDCLGTRESGVSRRVKVFENHPSLPDVFDYVLFNGNPSSILGH